MIKKEDVIVVLTDANYVNVCRLQNLEAKKEEAGE
jgi:hypothetical protein